jgi:chaperonin GroEL
MFRFDDDARAKMLNGVNTIADAVCKTLGPQGKLVLLEKNGDVRSTKDGITVAKNSLPLSDPFENMAAKLIVEGSQKVLESCGDGTSTVSLLIRKIVSDGLRLVAAGYSSVDIKRGLEWATEKVVEELKAIAKPVTSKQEIENVAVVSSNGDLFVGKLLADAMEKIGNSGVITLSEGKTTKTESEIVSGFHIEDRGYLSPHFANNEKQESVLKDPLVLICEKAISNVNIILPVLKKCHETYPGRPLFICAESVDNEALATLLVNHLKGAFFSTAIKCPGFGNRRAEILSDMAVVTGATVVEESIGIKLENFDVSWLGSAKQIIVTKGSTTIVNGAGVAEEIEKRAVLIRNLIKECDNEHDRAAQEKRLAKLIGGVCCILVGGHTESEMLELKDRIEDSLAAVRASIEDGIVPGGGISLLRSAAVLDRADVPEALRAGCKIIRDALEEPLRVIVSNGGIDPTMVRLKVLESDNLNFGYNARTGTFEDLMVSGVIDPTKVVRSTLEGAVSIAGLILTTECLVCNEPPKDPQSNNM